MEKWYMDVIASRSGLLTPWKWSTLLTGASRS